MAEEHDDWMGGLGVDIGALRDAASNAAASVVSTVEDTASTVGQAVSDAPPPVMHAAPAAAALPAAATAAMPAPASGPGLVEEAEEVVESGVRVIVRAAPEVAEATETAAEVGTVVVAAPVALGAIAVGGAALAATMLWSNTSIPSWEGQKNPDTGQDFTSQEEYDRYQASVREKRKNAQPLPPPVPGVDYDDENRPHTPSCDDMPSYIVPKCDEHWFEGKFENEADALATEPTADQQVKFNAESMTQYTNFPNPEARNNHHTYYDAQGKELFTLIRTPCCEETNSGPSLNWRWHSAS